MKKFKIYKVCMLIAVVLLSILLFVPLTYLSPSLILLIFIITYTLIISLYPFLFAVLNYFKQPYWKKIAVVILLVIQYVPILVAEVRDMPPVLALFNSFYF